MEKNKEEKKERAWYAVHTYSGYEDAVVKYLKQRINSYGISDKIFDVIVPKELKIKVKNGKRYEVEEKIYPGYVLVNMILDNDSWYVVRNTPRVMGFVGIDGTKPTPLSEKEVEELLLRMQGNYQKFNIDLKINDMVKIIDGPFKDQEGKVSAIDEVRGRVKVIVPIFGRDTIVELDSLQIRKI
jgi:transcriptional antiterminator NusG